MKISFGIVAYNEEDKIERCLSSLVGVADEIILVHDGPCTDRTLEIARKYTDKIFVRERLGGSDPHRLFILRQIKNDWLFIIDSDEYLSEGLSGFLKKENLDLQDCAAAAFKWPLWNGKKYVTFSNYRPCLFNKNKCWAISLHNFSIQAAGKICKFDHIIEHRPSESKVGINLVFTKLAGRARRDAKRFNLGYEKLDKYNEHLIPESFKNWFREYTENPLLYAFVNLIKHFLGSLKNNYRDGIYGIIVSLQLGLYQFVLAVNIWKEKKLSGNKDI